VRRGEIPFVAVRVGRSNDPREVLGLARELRIHRAQALGFLMLWEELILEVGDARAGRVQGYTAAHLAAKLGWEGPPGKLLEALKHAGVLVTHRGTMVHPYWGRSPTGIYSRMRAERRDQWAESKRKQRNGEAGPVDVHVDVNRTSAGLHPMSGGNVGSIDRSIERTPTSPPPPPPPPRRGGGGGGGGGGGAARRFALGLDPRTPQTAEGFARLYAAPRGDVR
jgi:hypothetical protein